MADIRVGSFVMEREGEGPDVVMIHGLGGSSNTFQLQLGALDGYRVTRVDLPGAARSELMPGQTSLTDMATHIQSLLQATGISKAYLVGHSMGTLVCQSMAVQNPNSIVGMSLLGPISEPPAASRTALIDRADMARKNGMADIATAVAHASLSAHTQQNNPTAVAFVRESLMRQSPGSYAVHCEALSKVQARELGKIECPVQLVTGDKDPVAPVQMALALKKALPNAALEVLEDVGHWPTLEAPEKINALLRSHIETCV